MRNISLIKEQTEFFGHQSGADAGIPRNEFQELVSRCNGRI